MHTPAFATFITPARVRPELWRLGLGIILVAVIWFSWILLVMGAILLTSGVGAFENWMARMAMASTPTSVVLLLSTFAGCALGTFAAVRLIHKRSIWSVFGPMPRVLRGFVLAAGIAAGVLLLSETLWPVDYVPVPNTEFGLWLNFLPLALMGILVQTGAEEILFRGYLQQQLAARFASPWVWMLVPSLVFGLLHFDPNTAPLIALWVVSATTIFGLIAADLTRLTGSIGAAWGMHFINNAVAILFVSLDGALSGLSLYVTPFDSKDLATLQPLFLRDIAVMILIWGAIRCVYAWRAR